MQQQLLLSLWLSQIEQGYRFSVATPLLCLKQSHHMQHQILWVWPDHSLEAYYPVLCWTELNREFYLPVQVGFGYPRYEISEVVFLAYDTVFVPRWRVHTQISCNVGDLSMVVPYERGVDLVMLTVRKRYVSLGWVWLCCIPAIVVTPVNSVVRCPIVSRAL